jgi:hypothetical protein
VEADRLETGSPPRSLGSAPEVGRLEGRFRSRAEDEADVAPLALLVLDEDIAERAYDWNGAPTRAALGLDLDAVLVVVGSLDANHAARQVDVPPAERHELAAAQASVERSCPDGSVSFGERREESLRLLRRRDPIPSAPYGGEAEMRAGVVGEITVLHRAAEDDAQRHERVSDRRRISSLGEEVVGDPLDIAMLNVA